MINSHTHVEFPETVLQLSRPCSSDLHQCVPNKAREHLWLVGGSGGTGDLALIAGVGDELHGKLEHEAVRVLLDQLVEELAPCLVANHLLQPRRGLGAGEGDRRGDGDIKIGI